jgi:hypothetical protein
MTARLQNGHVVGVQDPILMKPCDLGGSKGGRITMKKAEISAR